MSIESMGLNRPVREPVRSGRASRAEHRAQTGTPPAGRRFDAAEVRGDRPQPPRASSTEEALGRLHEQGLLENVSRPLTQDGHRTAEEELAMLKHTIDPLAGATLRPIPPEARGIPDAELQMPMHGVGDRRPEPMREPPMEEGRVYGRPRPQPPQRPDGPPRSDGMFTMRLFSPQHDTGRVLKIGDYSIPVEEDGSILAGMPDGTVRRITINQDKMDEMVANGEIWLNGKQVAPAKAEHTDSVSIKPADDGDAEDAQTEKKVSDDAANGTERYSKGNPALVSQLKADLERRQAQMLDMVREMLGRQGKAVSGDGIWKTLASGNFQVDAATRSQAQKNIADDGFWGVEQTSDRIVQFAMGLAGSSPEMLNKMEEAFEKGYAAAEKKWGGALPEISQRTRQRVHEKFEELRKQQNQQNSAAKTESEGTAE